MRRCEWTRALVEGDPLLARGMVREIEDELGADALAVLDDPREELVMVQVRETAHGTLFFLGEALMTSCRVRLDGALGLGLVLGGDRCRAYELAVVDAVLSGERASSWEARWDSRLSDELARIDAREAAEARRVAKTKVDFSTMEMEA